MANLRDDIEKYLSGKLSPAEMHALEKKALDDPFLAEALEGGATISPDDFISDVKNIRTTIADKTRKGSSGPPFWRWPMRVAAGLLLLAASAYVVFLMTNKKAVQDTIALQNSHEAAPEPSGFSDSAASAPDTNAEQYIEQPPVNDQSESPSSASRKADKPINSEIEAKGYATPDDKVAEIEETDREEQVADARVSNVELSKDVAGAELKSDEEVRKKSQLSEIEKSKAQRLAQSTPASAPLTARSGFTSNVVKGKVTDGDDGLPLPGVNVLVKGSTTGTVTDLNGNFQITIPPNQSNLVFSYIGMESQEVALEEKDKEAGEVNVQLSPDVSELSEIEVVGYGTGEEKEFEATKWELTEPEGGKKAYKSYLQKNLSYPEVAIENKVEGKVTVQFIVEPNGQLTDFRVVKSLGNGCDDEVIRLIKAGPKWTPTKRNDEPVRSKAKVKMRFDLPDKKK